MTPKNTGPRGDDARKPIALALQGGGMHGAYTWGVLDRLLEDDRLAIEGVSATSAGAMNAAVLAYGLSKGGGVLAACPGIAPGMSEATGIALTL